MGTWAPGPFDNDQALDWIADLVKSPDLSLILAALSIDPNDGALDIVAGVDVLIAAEVVAALTGRPSDELPDEVVTWVETHRKLPAGPLKQRARDLVEAVLAPASELHELWEENPEEFVQWKAGVADLLARLQ
jgi:hypothetical protein